MRHSNRWMLTTLIMAGLPLLACSEPASSAASEAASGAVAHIDGLELSGVTLTEKAMQRIDIETTAVRKELVPSTAPSPVDGFQGLVARRIVPYSSLIYDTHGGVWVYTNPRPRTFVRHRVDVYGITGDRTVLREGPAVGTKVVTLGAAELYGTELALRD